MKKSILFKIIPLLLVLSLITACQKPQAPAAKKPPVPAPKVIQKEKALAPVEAYAHFVTIRRSSPIDFDKLQKLYIKSLKHYVQASDEIFGTTLDTAVVQALSDAMVGKDVGANAQVAEKSIQRAFILRFTSSLERLEKDMTDAASFSEVTKNLPVIQTVATRRSEWVNKGTEYVDTLNQAMETLSKAITEKNQASLSESATRIFAIENKVILLSVMYELGGLAETRGTDMSEAGEKRVEAGMYYLSLKPEHEKRNKAGAATVSEMFEKPVDQIDVDLLQKILYSDFKSDLADVDKNLLGQAS